MTRSARAVGLLRTLAKHLEWRELPFRDLTQSMMREEALGHVLEKPGGILAIRAPGHYAFPELTDHLYDCLPEMARGATCASVQNELFAYIERYLGHAADLLGSDDADALTTHFQQWYTRNAVSRRVFVPCVISGTPAPRFQIGPVTFEHIDRIATSDFCTPPAGEESLARSALEDMLKWMWDGGAHWLARASVEGCEKAKAEEFGELAVDLAIVALQLAAPEHDTQRMARLDARRGTVEKRSLSESGSFYDFGWTNRAGGMTIGAGTLAFLLRERKNVFDAVGTIVTGFASGAFRLPSLESAWCDAAYWFHQALTESIDTIAIAKLETSLEVLLHSQNTRGSEQRVLQALHAFYGLAANDPVSPGSMVSAQQFAKNLVRDRSRILHGTWSTLNARVNDRAGFESFVLIVLRKFAVELNGFAGVPNNCDETDKFLDWVASRRREN